ncbi:MAG TPA: hypothetical protein VK447_21875, partial [Myxococcaceae bacterium]|nr:hypothetical protein [Myxococcaceae bacterium]
MSPRLNLHPRRALAALGAALVLLTAGRPATASAASAPPRAPAAPAASTQRAPALLPELSALVTRQRKIIVLMDGHQALDEVTRERATLVGRLLSTENHEAREALTERLSGELSQAVARGQEPASVRALLDALERP